MLCKYCSRVYKLPPYPELHAIINPLPLSIKNKCNTNIACPIEAKAEAWAYPKECLPWQNTAYIKSPKGAVTHKLPILYPVPIVFIRIKYGHCSVGINNQPFFRLVGRDIYHAAVFSDERSEER